PRGRLCGRRPRLPWRRGIHWGRNQRSGDRTRAARTSYWPLAAPRDRTRTKARQIMYATANTPSAANEITAKRKPRVMGSNSPAYCGEVSRCAIPRTAASASETGLEGDNPQYNPAAECSRKLLVPIIRGVKGPVVESRDSQKQELPGTF